MDGAAVWLQTASSIPVYVTMGEYNIHVKKQAQHINCTHLFTVLVAFPAISGRSKSVREVWVAGAAVWLTAAELHLPRSRIRRRDRCDSPPVMATSMTAAPTVQMQSTMGGGEGGRMRVVSALRQSKERRYV
jgi:hypothetical protein